MGYVGAREMKGMSAAGLRSVVSNKVLDAL